MTQQFQAAPAVSAGAADVESVSFGEATRLWLKVGCLSFGGPAGQIALMHRMVVDEKRWVGEERFLHALNYCMLLPGPEAQQLAIYLGWLLHRTAGGLVAGILFVLPGALVMAALSLTYVWLHQFDISTGIFLGLKAAVLAIVVEAVIRIGKRALKNGWMVAIAVAAFVAIFLFQVPFPLIVLGAGAIGAAGAHGGRTVCSRRSRQWRFRQQGPDRPPDRTGRGAASAAAARPCPAHARHLVAALARARRPPAAHPRSGQCVQRDLRCSSARWRW